MDWTAVFMEDGNEDLIIPQIIEQRERRGAPRLARLVSRRYHHHHDQEHYDGNITNDGNLHRHFGRKDDNLKDTIQSEEQSVASGHHRLLELASYYETPDESGKGGYTLRSMYFLSINYILGVGILGIPYSFAKAGFLLCLGLLAIVTIFSYWTVMWVAESGVRYQQLVKKKSRGEEEPLLTVNGTENSEEGLGRSAKRYEVIDLVDFFLGKFQKGIYQVALLALMYVGLLAYAQVFCNALAAVLWSKMGVPQIVFGAIVVPLSCMELEEQLGLQSVMASIRFIAIFIIAFGSLVALFLDGSRSNREAPPYFARENPQGCAMSYTSCFSGFSVAFSTFVFAQLFQHSVPGLLRPLQDKPSQIKRTPIVLGGSLLTTSFLYVLLGMFAASFFGADTQSSINLNFANFTFGVDSGTAPPFIIAFLRCCSTVVVVFPALDTLSIFPLIAHTLGNNLLSSYGSWSIRKMARWLVRFDSFNEGGFSSALEEALSDKRYDSLEADIKRRILEKSTEAASVWWKIVASVPPVLVSIIASDLSISLQLAGIAGIYVAFVAPSLLQIQSIRQSGSDSQTIYHGWFSSIRLCVPVLVFAGFSLAMSVWQLLTTIL
ncbi:transmembrane amino acid transporter [Nitzschia inconspicua]|uniref:Transmembrane amino acid transporter n=1 Tax=Nitzschia inconspicua TaxID=303405 RepID=A0A9K3KNG6_9STRA|nr:transmembrane amino acid transporter [Nitzschia inconspicua]